MQINEVCRNVVNQYELDLFEREIERSTSWDFIYCDPGVFAWGYLSHHFIYPVLSPTLYTH